MTTHDVASVDVKNMLPGSLLDVETKTRHYLVECLGGNAIRISGHPEYCPDPVPAELGSVGEDGVEIGRIGSGQSLMIMLNGVRPITTSRVVSIHLEETVPSSRLQ